MPYQVVKVDKGFKVKKKQPGRPRYFSKKPLTKTRAIKQLQAILISEHRKKS